MFFRRKQNVSVAADHVLERQGDTAPQEPNLGKLRVDNCPLLRFDIGVPGTLDLVQEPAQSAMSPDEAGAMRRDAPPDQRRTSSFSVVSAQRMALMELERHRTALRLATGQAREDPETAGGNPSWNEGAAVVKRRGLTERKR
jgi:hypothetical protein